MQKIIVKKVLIILGFLFILCCTNPKQVKAQSYTELYPTRYDATNWQVLMNYYDVNGNHKYGPYSTYTSLGSSGDHYGAWEINGRPAAGDNITWHTACVDPSTDVSLNRLNTPDGIYYSTTWDAGCHYGVINATYAGCDGLSSGTNYGNIPAGADCPGNIYCARAGVVNMTACRDSCGGSGSCTWENRNCSGTSCVISTSTPYSDNCGGVAISGTDMCGKYSYSCSPPPPSFTLSSSCTSGVKIVVNRTSNVQFSNGVYHMRWKKSGGSWTNVCSTSDPYTISGLASSTTYDVELRGDTASGYNGPTNFTSHSITTCAIATPTPTTPPAVTPTTPPVGCTPPKTNPYYTCSGSSCTTVSACGTSTCNGPSDITSCNTCVHPDPSHGCGAGEVDCGGCCIVGSSCGPTPTSPPGSCQECVGQTCTTYSASPCTTTCVNNCGSATCP